MLESWEQSGAVGLAGCSRLLGAGRLSHRLFGVKHQFSHVEAPTKALRQGQHSSAGSRLVFCVPQNMTDYGYLHQCVHSPSLNTCLNSFLSDEGHKPFPTTHQPGSTFIYQLGPGRQRDGAVPEPGCQQGAGYLPADHSLLSELPSVASFQLRQNKNQTVFVSH